MKLGGLSVISVAARSLVLKKKAGERVIDLEKATWQLPIRVPPSPSVKSAAAPRHARLPEQMVAPPALSVVEEEDLEKDVDMEESDDESILEGIELGCVTALSNFLCGRLLGNANPAIGLTRNLILSVCKFFGGSIHPVLFSLRRDRHLPVDVSNETLVDEFTRPPSGYSTSPLGRKPLPHDCHTTLTRVGLDPAGTEPLPVHGAVHHGAPVATVPITCMSSVLPWALLERSMPSELTPLTALPGNPAEQADNVQYTTPAILNAVVLSQSHVSATPTPTPATAAPSTSAIQVTLGAPVAVPSSEPAPLTPSAAASRVSMEIPVTAHAPGMAKYYAPVPCPPLPVQPSQSSTYTWPDSLLDVALEPAPSAAPPAGPAPPSLPLLRCR